MKSLRRAVFTVLILFGCIVGVQNVFSLAAVDASSGSTEVSENITECTPFNSFAEIEEYINAFNRRYPSSGCGFLFGCKQAPGEDQQPGDEGMQAGDDFLSNGDSLTNTQVENVDEADIIKVSGGRIFTANTTYTGGISVINAHNDSVFRIPCYDYAPDEFYVDGTRLLVVGHTKRMSVNDYPVGYSTPEDLKAEGNVVFMVYDISALLPVAECDYGALTYSEQMLVRRMTFYDYGLATTRKVGNYVYGVFVSPSLRGVNKALMPKFYDSVARGDVSLTANRIYKAPHNRSSLYMVTLVGFDLTDTSRTMNASAYLTSGNVFYASENSFYTSFDYYQSYQIRTNVMRFEIYEGNFRFFGTAQMDGYLKDQFCMDEYENTFRAVVTEAESRTGADVSRLYVFDCSESGLDSRSVMRQIGRSAEMGRNEKLYSVRFDRTSCVVTTAVTVDPVYYIDLSDPVSPVITSELKSEGANTYLHPLNEEGSLILGLGHGTNIDGIKLSVYYRDDNKQLRELMTYQNPDIRYNEVLENHKALLVYGDLFAFPVNYRRSVYTGSSYYRNESCNGLLTFRISGDLKDYDLTDTKIQAMDYRLLVYRNGDYNTVNDSPKRGVVANYKLYMVGNEAAFSFSLEDLSPLSALGLTKSYSPPEEALSTDIESISVTSDDGEFNQGITVEEFASMLTVKAQYVGGKNAVCLPAKADMIEGFSSEPGSHSVTVTYAGKSQTFDYEILQTSQPSKVVDRIEVFPAEAQFSIHTTAEAAAAVLKMNVYYKDGTSALDLSVNPAYLRNFRSDQAGVYSGTVVYKNVSGYFEYTIVDDRVLASVVLYPEEITVVQGADLSRLLEQFYLIKVYSDGSTKKVLPTADMVSGYSSEAEGDFTATVTYGGKDYELKYTVIAAL